jgi:hypothetical protein
MSKIVSAAVLAAAAMAGFSGNALAGDVPAQFVGIWKEVPDGQPGTSYAWTIYGNGQVALDGRVVGQVLGYNQSDISFSFTNGDYRGTIAFNRSTRRGQVYFSGAPSNSPKRRNPGPYGIAMTSS